MPVKKKTELAKRTVVSAPVERTLLSELRQLIEDARTQVARIVDAGLTLLYWQVGHRIHTEVLGEKRADYGAKIVVTVSRELQAEFGRGFEEKNLRRMVQFAEVFPDREIVATLSRQLSWSHFIELIPLNKPHQRDFYAEMCPIERWSIRTLRQKISGLLYERTALSKKPDFLCTYEKKYRPTMGPLRSESVAAVQAFSRCGDLAAGFSRLVCTDCGHPHLLAFTCKARYLCPACHQRRTLQSARWIAHHVCLPVPHRQFVFTIPKILRGIFRKRRHLLTHLFHTATTCLRDAFRTLLNLPDGRLAAAAAVHTFGDYLLFNPHIHLLAADGLFDSQGRIGAIAGVHTFGDSMKIA